jgi:hypothetical protein
MRKRPLIAVVTMSLLCGVAGGETCRGTDGHVGFKLFYASCHGCDDADVAAASPVGAHSYNGTPHTATTSSGRSCEDIPVVFEALHVREHVNWPPTERLNKADLGFIQAPNDLLVSYRFSGDAEQRCLPSTGVFQGLMTVVLLH